MLVDGARLRLCLAGSASGFQRALAGCLPANSGTGDQAGSYDLAIFQQPGRSHAKALRDPGYIVDRDISFRPLHTGKIGTVDSAFVCQSLLTETTVRSEASHVLGQHVSQGPLVSLFHEAISAPCRF